jgi:uncharacterized protein YPO0396
VTDTVAALFYLPGADEGITQWKVESLQLVNWGGFHGWATVGFAPTATLLSGASGTGKSTLLDAYVAVMMDSSVPFNGASNDATVGRARGADQRSLVSYLRGKKDTGRDSVTGELADQVLRGRDSATWGAVAVTFIDDNQRRYTVARLYYVPRSAARDGDLTRKMCTIDGTIDLRDVEPFAAEKFDKRAVTGRFANLTMYDTYDAFSQAFFTRLGIGANGDGAKALRLLARIQGGQKVSTVDGLYKSMVIEPPGTYAAADAALAHFQDLEDAHNAMLTEELKANVLAPIPELNDTRAAALDAARLIDGLGVHLVGDSPFSLWKLTTEDALLATAETANRVSHSKAGEDEGAARRLQTGLTSRKVEIEQDLGDSESHATIERLDAAIAELGIEHEAASSRRSEFDRQIACLDLTLTSEADFAAAKTSAQAFVDGYADALKDANDRRDGLLRESWTPLQEKSDLEAEQISLTGRAGAMERRLHESRLAIAGAADMDPADLPFLAELIDVLPEQRRWRKAIETTLFGPARVLLIDAEQLERVSRIIDPLRLPQRINFQGVDLNATATTRRLDPDLVSGKLAYKDSPFTAWVKDRVAADGTDALCVESPQALSGPGRRVTANGQTRSGLSGAHGELNAPNVIGFTNTERLAEIKQELARLKTVIAGFDARRIAIDGEIRRLQETRDAHGHILAAEWRGIDPDGIAAEIDEKERQKQVILDSDDALCTLRTELKQIKDRLEEASRKIFAAETRIRDLNAAWEKIIKRKDDIVGEIDRIGREQMVLVTAHQAAYLDAQYAEVATTGELEGFSSGAKRLEGRLVGAAGAAREKAAHAQTALETVFQRYLDKWSDPNLSSSVENYPSFRKILDNILETGLHHRRHEWTRRLTDWSGQDLVPLAGAFGNAIEEIENRLAPVNDILARLPFGARRDRLKIDLRELHRDDIVKFKRELNALARLTVDGLADGQIQAGFRRLQSFMALIRADEAGKRNRDYFLDVRKHIEITAVAYDSDGHERATFAALGGKSGGESQELVAFIVGAALRFQLGDDENVRPRFAPVFLDEGFVKADGEFTGRSIDAWKGLGFQLIIGAPYDKYTSLEPHADHVLYMAKNSVGHSAVTTIVPGKRKAAEQSELVRG